MKKKTVFALLAAEAAVLAQILHRLPAGPQRSRRRRQLQISGSPVEGRSPNNTDSSPKQSQDSPVCSSIANNISTFRQWEARFRNSRFNTSSLGCSNMLA